MAKSRVEKIRNESPEQNESIATRFHKITLSFSSHSRHWMDIAVYGAVAV